MPWVCTVFYVSDSDLNVYWVSKASRRHSSELHENPQAAGAVCISERPLIGLQMQGAVSIVASDAQKSKVVDLFKQQQGSTQEWANKVLAGEGGRAIYVLRPEFFAVFDTESLHGDPRAKWRPTQ
jgi:hypothetical protein